MSEANGGRAVKVDWECLAFGKSALPPLRKTGIGRKFRAAIAYLRACFIYRRHGLPGINSYFCDLQRCFRPLGIASSEEAVRRARWEMVSLRILGRFVRENYLCLPASVSLTAGLIALGLPASLVVGKARHYISPNYDFHAWTEIMGIPINEVPQAQKYFVCLCKYPNWGSFEWANPKLKMRGGETMIADKQSEVTKKTGKLTYEKPFVEVLGRMEELTGSGGFDNDDGWGTDGCP